MNSDGPTPQLLVHIAAQARRCHATTFDALGYAIQETIHNSLDISTLLARTYLKASLQAARSGSAIPSNAVVECHHPRVAAKMENLQVCIVRWYNSECTKQAIDIAVNQLASEISLVLGQDASTPCDEIIIRQLIRQQKYKIEVLTGKVLMCQASMDETTDKTLMSKILVGIANVFEGRSHYDMDVLTDQIDTAEAELAEMVRWLEQKSPNRGHDLDK